MPEGRGFLAIDIAAAAVRLVLGCVDSNTVVANEICRFPNELVSYNGRRHWDMPAIWRHLRAGLNAVAQLEVPIEALGVTGPGRDYALLAEGGVLLENPYYGGDASAGSEFSEALRLSQGADIFGQTGTQPAAAGTLFQLYSEHRNSPRILEAADHFLTIPDLVNFWLTGVIACEYTNATTTQLLAWRTRLWACGLLRRLGLPVHFLSPIVAPGTVLGPLRAGIGVHPVFDQTVVVVPACNAEASAVSVRADGTDAFLLQSGGSTIIGVETAEPVVTAEARELGFTNEGAANGTNRLMTSIGPDAGVAWQQLEAVSGRCIASVHLITDDEMEFGTLLDGRHPVDTTITAEATARGNIAAQLIARGFASGAEWARAVTAGGPHPDHDGWFAPCDRAEH